MSTKNVQDMSPAEYRQAVKDLNKPPAPTREIDRANPPKTVRDMSADEYAAARRAVTRG